MKKKLERKRFRIKDDKGNLIGNISAISMVTRPAIEKGFGLFEEAEVEKKINFQVSNEEQMIIMGPVMVPNQNIVRYDELLEEYYYCFFTEQDVKDYSEVYLQNANHRQANFEHQDNFSDAFFICESWIVVDPHNDKSNALGFKNIPAGTWMASYKCTDSKMWAELKESGLTGFSVEIELEEFNELKLRSQLESIVDSTELTREAKIEAIRNIVFKK